MTPNDLDTPGNLGDQNLTRNMQLYKMKMTMGTKQVFNDTERIVSGNGGCR